MILFFVGIIEMIIITVWTKVVTKTQIVASGVITMLNIFIWYYVLQTIVDDINNIFLVAMYAVGCSLGTILTMIYFQKQEKNLANSPKSNS